MTALGDRTHWYILNIDFNFYHTLNPFKKNKHLQPTKGMQFPFLRVAFIYFLEMKVELLTKSRLVSFVHPYTYLNEMFLGILHF